MTRFAAVACLAMLLLAPSSDAQQSPLGGASRDTLDRLVASARDAGLPADPLLAKVAEGALKGASDARILQAVRTLLRELGDARAALPRASTGTLVAAASAIHAGVTPDGLRRVAADPGIPDGDLGVAFVTLADLVASRVPPDVATSTIADLVGRRAGEAELTALRLGVARDVSAGLTPVDALQARARGLVGSLDPARAGRPPE